MSKWIWKFGEFEVYHNLLLHNRRQQYGYPEPVVWKLYAPEPVVNFRKKVTTDGGVVRMIFPPQSAAICPGSRQNTEDSRKSPLNRVQLRFP